MKTDIKETDAGYELEIDLPGFQKDQIELTLENGYLNVAAETKNCTGTSNVLLAKKYNLKPIGTYAHEFVQMYQGIESIPLAYTNHYALEDWYDEYRGDNGTALTDTVTTDLFLLDFNRA